MLTDSQLGPRPTLDDLACELERRHREIWATMPEPEWLSWKSLWSLSGRVPGYVPGDIAKQLESKYG